MVCHPNFDWCTCTREKVIKHDSGEKHACVLHFKAVLSDLELFQLIIDHKRSKTSKKCVFFQKPPGVKGLMLTGEQYSLLSLLH